VGERSNYRVKNYFLFASNGTNIADVTGVKIIILFIINIIVFFLGSHGHSSSQLYYPKGITPRDPNSDTIYIADYDNHELFSRCNIRECGCWK
jgi:hypothetical protein